MRANQPRLWSSSLACVFLSELRRVGLRRTQVATTTCQTIRLKLLKIGARVLQSIRRVTISLAEGHPFQDVSATAAGNLAGAYHLPL